MRSSQLTRSMAQHLAAGESMLGGFCASSGQLAPIDEQCRHGDLLQASDLPQNASLQNAPIVVSSFSHDDGTDAEWLNAQLYSRMDYFFTTAATSQGGASVPLQPVEEGGPSTYDSAEFANLNPRLAEVATHTCGPHKNAQQCAQSSVTQPETQEPLTIRSNGVP